MTVVMVTHERALAERFAQRLIFLADGKLVSSTPVSSNPELAGRSAGDAGMKRPTCWNLPRATCGNRSCAMG